jgi:hypothetical protein
MMPELETTEIQGNSIPADRDELAELLLYFWLRTEMSDDYGLPLALKASSRSSAIRRASARYSRREN